jgi:hypothetical protein
MSTATTALIAHLTTKVASIANDTDRLDCAVWLEEYAAALSAQVTASSSIIQSYSITGRSFTYRSLTEFNNRVAELRGMIDAALYGRGGYVDNRLDTEVSTTYA